MQGQLPDFVLVAALLVTLGLVPFMAVLATSYTKLVVVLGLLRLALGTQQTPPNMVVNGIAIVMTCYIMAPIGVAAYQPVERHLGAGGTPQATFKDFMSVRDAVLPPLREFLQKNTSERERQFFVKSSTALWPPALAGHLRPDDMLILIPSFTISELTEAFQVGFVIYLVFLVVDLLVGTILLSMGMSMISPTTIAIPFKLLLFVALDGWARLLQGLVLSYAR